MSSYEKETFTQEKQKKLHWNLIDYSPYEQMCGFVLLENTW